MGVCRRALGLVVALVPACSALACSAIWGIQELPAGSGGWSSDAASDAGDALDDVWGGPSYDAPDEPPPLTPVDAGCSCVAAAPPGWTGPLALYTSKGAAAPSCGGAYATAVFDGGTELNAPAASCTPCGGCGSPQGGYCGAQLSFYRSGICGQGATACAILPLALEVTPAGICQPPPINLSGCGGTIYGFTVDQMQSQGGSCQPPAQATANGASPSWGVQAVACAASSMGVDAGSIDAGACNASEVCAPSLPANVPLCIEGKGPCPSGPYSVEHDFYATWDDQRGCNACSCTDVNASCNLGGTYYFTTGSCQNTTSTAYGPITPNAGTCYGINVKNGAAQGMPAQAYYTIYGNVQWSPGSCQASGGGPNGGGVTPTQPATFCCTQ